MQGTTPFQPEMNEEELAHIRELIRIYTKRRRSLELNKAKLGGSCPPHILTELEEIQDLLAGLESKRQVLVPDSGLAFNQAEVSEESLLIPGGSDIQPLPKRSERLACPYPGMIPFRAEDARFFFGRESEIKRMLRHLRYRRVLCIVGPSGSGKSSLIHAGLLPRLQTSSLYPSGFWRVAEMRPGSQPLQVLSDTIGDLNHPVEALTDRLAAQAPAQRWLLVIDQFEEIFTQSSREEQAHFIGILSQLQKLASCAILIALRADFYPDLMTSDFWPMVQNRRLDIAPLRGVALRQAIQLPAEELGVHLDPELIERLVADAADEPGALPLIQETMTLLWAEMRGRRLALSDYQQISHDGCSGLAVALATKADAALDELSGVQQKIALRIFLRLIQFGEGRADTRRQQTIAALQSAQDDPALFNATIYYLTEHRLLTLDTSEGASRKVDLAHEALISGWPTLQRWLTEYREAEQLRRRIEAKVTEWVRLGRRASGLLDEAELAEVDRWISSPEAEVLGFDPYLPELVEASRAVIADTVLRQLSEQAQYRAADTLRDIARILASVLVPDEMTSLILDQLKRIVAYDSAILMLLQDGVLFIKNTRGLARTLQSRSNDLRFSPSTDPMIAQLVQSRRTLLLDNTRMDALPLPMGGEMIRSWIVSPLLIEDEVIGFLTVGHKTASTYTEEDAQLVFALASLAAQAIRNIRLFDELHCFAAELEQHVVERTAALAEANQQLQDEKGRLQAVHAITLELAQSLDLETTLTKALDLAARAVGARHGSIMLRDLAAGTLICRAVLTEDGTVHEMATPLSFTQGSSLANWVLANRTPAWVPDVRQDPRWLQEEGHATTIRSVVAIPLMIKEELLGVLMLSSPEVNSFSTAQIQLLSTVANEIGIVIHNAELYSFITDQSLHVSELLEQKRRENSKNQAILQSLTEGVMMVDEDRCVVLFNLAAERLLHIPASFIQDKPLGHLKTYSGPGAAARRADLIATALYEGLQVLDDGNVTYSRMLELPSPDQSIALHFADVIQPYGVRFGCVIVFSDLTHGIEADRARRDFITSVSRELRDPLTAVMGYVDLILIGATGTLTADQRTFLGTVKANARHLANLNNDIQLIGLIDADRICDSMSFEPVNIAGIFQDVLRQLRDEIERKSISVRIEVTPDLPMFFADELLVIEIVRRLVSNAVKFGYSGGRVILRAFLRPDELLQVEIEDNGVGLTVEQQQQIFRRFYRADNPGHGETSGAGLGLAIAKSFVELHNGKIWVQSQPGKGSTFCFTLPLKQFEQHGDG